MEKTQNTFKLQEDSDEHSTGSAALIGSNDDLLTEILLRMPVISIFRFKSVSKHWRCLLSDRGFTLRYDRLPKSPGLFVCNIYVPFDVGNRSRPPPFRSLDFYPDRYGIKIVQSCNGLLLCCTHGGADRDRKYYVYNPTTKQFAVIPSVPGGYKVRKTIRFMGLAFHQTDCVNYKVVCIHVIKPGEEELFRFLIYSSDTRKWKVSTGYFSAHLLPNDVLDAVYLNGAIHWLTYSFQDHLCFKVDAEQLQEFPLPVQVASSKGYYNKELPTCFGESRGHLHLVTRDPCWQDLRLNVYELLSDHSGWFVKCQIDLDEPFDAFKTKFYSATYHYYAIDLVRGEKKEDTFIVVKLFNKIIRYNVHDKRWKTICTLTSHRYGTWRGYRYIESMSSF